MPYYYSPLHLFAELNLPIDSASLDARALTLARKMLLAELELSPTQTIKTGAIELGKNDVLKMIEDLQKSETLPFHQAIYSDAVLLRFLETCKLEESKPQAAINDRYSKVKSIVFADNPTYRDAAFLTFVSPYFREAYQTILQQALYKKDRNTFRLVSQNPRFMSVSDEHRAFSRLLFFLKGKEDELDAAHKSVEAHGSVVETELAPFYHLDFIDCLNFLPEFFRSFRDAYSLSLINLGVVLHNRKYYKVAQAAIQNARDLNVSEYYRNLLEKYYTELVVQGPNSVYTNEGSSSNSGLGWGTILGVSVLLLRLLLVGNTCYKTTSNDAYSTLNNNMALYGNLPTSDVTTSLPIDTAFQWIALQLAPSNTYMMNPKALKTIENGSYLYTTIFKKRLFQAKKHAGDTEKPTLIAVSIVNETNNDLIILANTVQSDSSMPVASFARYIAAHQQIDVRLKRPSNTRLYFYIGSHFNPHCQFLTNGSNQKWNVRNFPELKGAFTNSHVQTDLFLKHPLDLFTLVPPESSQKDKPTLTLKEGKTEYDIHVLLSKSLLKFPRGVRGDTFICDKLYLYEDPSF